MGALNFFLQYGESKIRLVTQGNYVYMSMLKEEREFLSANRDQLLKDYGGKVLVISGRQVTGAYSSFEEALQGAVATHGLKNVLIRRPDEAEMEFKAPALTMGILRADISFAGPGATESH